MRSPPVQHTTTMPIDYSKFVSMRLPGLYTGFHSAFSVLSIARGLGQFAHEEEQQILADFFQLLASVESFLASGNAKQTNIQNTFVVVVEGLDGTGKSSVVQGLSQDNAWLPADTNTYHILSMATPTTSMTAARPIFDRAGGLLSRAFYMCSNYVLHYEIQQQQAARCCCDNQLLLVCVDRWYASTVAYSVAYKNTTGDIEAIDALSSELFEWPTDLWQPDLMLVLQVDDTVRRERVVARAKPQDDNPWDKRLNDDEQLARRIMRGLERVRGPRHVCRINANESKDSVIRSAQAVVRTHVQRRFYPQTYFSDSPLEYFQWSSAQHGLCDATTGKRRKHTPWAVTLACNAKEGAPSLRKVGIAAVDSAGILFFTRRGPGGGYGGDTEGLVSIESFHGSYPNEEQWRAEGFLSEVSIEECTLLQTFPPTSLQSEILACLSVEKSAPCTGDRLSRPKDYRANVTEYRRVIDSSDQNETFDPSIQATRFIPLRMEVLVGGPGSPAGPMRFEWKRDVNGWCNVQQILPFSLPSSIQGVVMKKPPLPVTVVMTGTHCAGKKIIGRRLANAKGWSFQAELGDVLRDDDLAVGGHKTGYATDSNSQQMWDERLREAELDRDERSSSSRVVETWHVGNLSWKMLRQDREASKVDRDSVLQIIQNYRSKSVVLFVHLTIPVEVSVARHKHPSNSKRLPLQNELVECTELHRYLEGHTRAFLEELSELSIPTFTIDNSIDSEEAMKETTRQIVQFVNTNIWRSSF